MIRLISCVIILLGISTTSWATCLDEAASYADRICGELVCSGSATHVDASGQVTAEAKGIIARVLGSASGEVDVNVLREKYTNVVRDELAGELRSVRDCRVKMEAVARNEVCRRPIIYNTCQHPSFGLAKWGTVEKIQSAAGWRGGWTQDAYCARLIQSSISAHNISGDRKAEVLSKWEEGKWGNATFRTNRQYRYNCIINLSYNPIYNSRQDPICGIQSR